MSDFTKPRPVWISPSVIGKALKPLNTTSNSEMAESQPQNQEALPSPPPEATDTAETATEEAPDQPITAAPPSSELSNPELQLLATMTPLPDPSAHEVEALDSSPKIITQEHLLPSAPETPSGLGTPSTTAWYCPTWSDEGLAARVWVSPQIAEWERWTTVKANLKTMELIPRSPFVPKTFGEYLGLRAEMVGFRAKELGKRLKHKETMAALGPDRPRVHPAFLGETFEDADNGLSRSGVGAEETFWSLWMQPTQARPRADWPSQVEMREEGDERNTSGFGRFPALPRVNGNETVNYKHKKIVTATPLDTVWPPPVPLAFQELVEEVDDDFARMLVGEGLAAAIDAD